jgi:hypothetical protein
MKVREILIVVTICLVYGCNNAIDLDKIPCQFAPATSTFPVVSSFCDECFFNLEIDGNEYSFEGNQIDTGPSLPSWFPENSNLTTETRNSLISFFFVSPSTMESLNNSIGVKQPLLTLDEFNDLAFNAPTLVTTSFGIFNYCKDYYEAFGTTNESFHELTGVEIIESGTFNIGQTEFDREPYQVTRFYATGRLRSIFDFNGETMVVTGVYRIQAKVRERL